jgi:hypothetical protein
MSLTKVFPQMIDLSTLVNASDDAAAALLGVAVGEMYRNGSILMVRVA